MLLVDRFVVDGEARAIDLATIEPVWLRWLPAGAVREQLAWHAHCDARLGDAPGRPSLVDYGFDATGRRFEAWTEAVPLHFCPSHGDTEITEKRDGKPLEAELVRLFEDQGEPGARVLVLQSASPAARQAALVRAARLARLHGFVPVALPLAAAPDVPHLLRPWVAAVLHERSICLLADGAGFHARRGARLWDVVVRQTLRAPQALTAILAAPAEVQGVDRVLLRPSTAVEQTAWVSRRKATRAAEQRTPYGTPGLAMPVPARWPAPDETTASQLRDDIAAADGLVASGRRAAGERRLRQLIGAAERRGLGDHATAAATALAAALLTRGRPRDALSVLEPARRPAVREAARGDLLRVAALAGRAWIDLARLDEAAHVLRTAAGLPAVSPGGGAPLALELARCLWWQGRFAEAADTLRSVPADPPGDDGRALAVRLQVAAAVGQLDDAHALAARTAELSPPARAWGETAAAWLHLATGDLDRACAAGGRAAGLARRARLPMLAAEARTLVGEAHRRAGDGGAAADALRGPLRLGPCLTPLVRAQVRLVHDLLGGQAPARTIVDRHVSTTGLAGLVWLAPAAVRGAAAPAGRDSLAACLVDILHACHVAGSETGVLHAACGRLRREIHAAGVAVFLHDAGGPVPLAQDGAPMAGEAAARAIAAGIAIGPAHRDGPACEAVPIAYGGDVLGALAVVWPFGALPVRTEATVALGPVAAAIAPVMAAVHASRRAAAAGDADPVIGTSDAIRVVREAAAQAARAPFPVLIEGESGSGKELVARAVHRGGPRRERPFVSLNCAALPEELVESELFGHARGAFTGAAGERAGVFEEAHGGTLFLDEVGELSARAQAKLLRVLQEGEVRRLGESGTRRVDARVVAATNRDLRRDVDGGRFRADLLYRLDVVRIRVPPLRERREDVPPLVEAYWRDATARLGSRAVLAAGTMAALTRYDWPGNVRELQNVLAALAVRCARRGVVPPSALPPEVSEARGEPLRLDEARRAFEERFVRGALARAGGRQARAAVELGVSRQGLTKLMKRLGIQTRA